MFKRKKKEESLLTEADSKAMLANCKCGKHSDFPKNPFRVKTLPLARMFDKYARDNNIQLVEHPKFDKAEKSAVFTYENGTKADTKTISYKMFCDHFEWDGFSVSDNGQSVLPKW